MKKDNKQKFKTKNPKATFKRILSYLKPYWLLLIIAGISLLATVGCNVSGTFLITIILDDYILPLAFKSGMIHDTAYALQAQSITMADFGTIIGVLATVYIVGALLHYVYNYILVIITTKVLQNVRNELFESMEKLPVKYFDTHTHGDLMSRYTNDTDTLRALLTEGLPNMCENVLSIIAIFVMMTVLSPLLTLLIVGMLIIMLFIMQFIGKKSAKNFVLQQQSIGALNGFVEEHVEGLKVVKVFCHEEQEKIEFNKKNNELRNASQKAFTYANVLMPIAGNLSYVNYAITAIVGTLFAISGFNGMTWGSLVGFLQYSRQFNHPLAQIAQQVNTVFMALAGAERIFEMIDENSEVDDGYVTLVNADLNADDEIVEADHYTGIWAWKHYHKDTDSTSYAKWNGEVEFENVSFGYNEDKLVLKNINLTAHSGQKIAFVGSTGAGKTTITNLINRFYDINDGKIRYDHINVKKINKDDLRHSLAMVLQDTHLFTGTVRDNIRFGKLDASDDEVENAAKLANADYFINHLPQGYDTLISGDGSNLSQGQKQLLAIARAAVANPPVLILDEATSSIDTRTEKLIEKGMDQLMEGRTVFVIAHRLSTVRNADKIIVLEHGEIIERGNHEELIAKKGKYYQLYTGAFELE